MLGKTKLHTIEVLISSALINSYISQDEFVSVNILKEYNEMKKKKKLLKLLWNTIFKYGWYIGDNDGILWLSVKHIEEGLNHKHLWQTTIKYHSKS